MCWLFFYAKQYKVYREIHNKSKLFESRDYSDKRKSYYAHQYIIPHGQRQYKDRWIIIFKNKFSPDIRFDRNNQESYSINNRKNKKILNKQRAKWITLKYFGKKMFHAANDTLYSRNNSYKINI